MRIGVDATCWANGRGYGRYTRHLLPEMAAQGAGHEFVCFLDARAAESFRLDAPNVRPVVVPQSRSPTEAAAADGNRSPADMLRLTRAVWRERPDVFFSPVGVHLLSRCRPGMRAVVTVHDAIAERFPELTLPSAAGPALLAAQGGTRRPAGAPGADGVRFLGPGHRPGTCGSPPGEDPGRRRGARAGVPARSTTRTALAAPAAAPGPAGRGAGGSSTWADSTPTSTWTSSCGPTPSVAREAGSAAALPAAGRRHRRRRLPWQPGPDPARHRRRRAPRRW